MARRINALLPVGERRPETSRLVSMTARITSPHRGDRVRFAPVRGDLGIDVGGRQGIEPAPLGAAPGFLQPVGRWRGGAYEILHAHDDDGGLAASVDDALPDGKCAGISMLIIVSCGKKTTIGLGTTAGESTWAFVHFRPWCRCATALGSTRSC